MSTMTSRLEPAVRPRTLSDLEAPTRFFVCAECRYAQLFAVQPRAFCTRAGGALKGRALFAGQPGCAQFVPRSAQDLTLAWSAPGAP